MTYSGNYHTGPNDLYPGVIFLFLWLAFYLAPSLVAWWRGHKNLLAIFVLNFFLGWTCFGWIVAFVWAFTSHVRMQYRKDELEAIGLQSFEPGTFTLRQVVGETDIAYDERLRRLRDMKLAPAPQ